MPKTKVAITLDEKTLSEIDRLVAGMYSQAAAVS